MIFRFCFLITFFLSLPLLHAQSPYTWQLKQSGSSLGNPVTFDKNSPNNVYYGTINKILKSTDYGETFSQMGTTISNSNQIKNLILHPTDSNTMLVAIEGGQSVPFDDKIVKTTNSGQTWVNSITPLKFSYFGIPMTQDPSHPLHIYTMSDQSFMRTTDFGESWDTLSVVTTFNAPDDIEIFPDTSIILLGDNGVGIMKSTDYGYTWTQVFWTSGEIPTIAIDKLNPGTAYGTKWAGGGGFVKTTDYGSTWSYINYFNGKYTWGLDIAPNNSNYIIVGEYTGDNYITNNGGATWFITNIPSNNYSITIIDTMNVFAAQGNGFYKLWSESFIPVELISFNAYQDYDKVILNWITASETNSYGFEIERKAPLNLPQGETLGEWERIGFVEGNGTTTTKQFYSFIDDNITQSRYSYRLKQIDLDGTFTYSTEIELAALLPLNFLLEQNYPNPFNPSTTINYQLPKASLVTIKLFDVLGNEVMTLIENQWKEAGSHSYELVTSAGGYGSGNELVSGVYFFRMQTEGFSQTRKMILLR
ncbi:MAG: T9SS type A sorting domain-containing protein [Ignavibacteria bacterium]|nr:T9SS type A sorting domain-containing protein [Ignavibacteria bacterium]